jgi:hypothetical protein
MCLDSLALAPLRIQTLPEPGRKLYFRRSELDSWRKKLMGETDSQWARRVSNLRPLACEKGRPDAEIPNDHGVFRRPEQWADGADSRILRILNAGFGHGGRNGQRRVLRCDLLHRPALRCLVEAELWRHYDPTYELEADLPFSQRESSATTLSSRRNAFTWSCQCRR